MLNALKKQLVSLSETDKKRFMSVLKKKAGSGDAKLFADPIKNFILVMPEMISQISVWSEQDTINPEVRRLHGYVLTYLYHPVDFLHDEGYGFFGYLDDAYLIGLAYRTTMEHVDQSKLRYLPNQTDLGRQIDGWLASAKKIIPKESAQIDKMIQDLLSGQQSSFQHVLAGSGRK